MAFIRIVDGFPHLGPRRVLAPDGVEWRVGRRWLTRRPSVRPSKRRPSSGEVAAESLRGVGSGMPDLGNLDLGEGALVIAATVAIILVLTPVLFFGLDLIVLGALLAAGVLGRSVRRQPWVIEARADGRPLLEWRARGWRNSARLIEQVSSELAAGREPPERDGLAR